MAQLQDYTTLARGFNANFPNLHCSLTAKQVLKVCIYLWLKCIGIQVSAPSFGVRSKVVIT